MPTFRFTARWQGETLLPEDVYENVLYYDVTQAEGIFETVADGIVAAFDTWTRHGGINGAEVRVYELAGGQPLYSKSYVYAKTSASAPGEVALCLSYAASSSWDTTTARRRGRIFCGPLQAAVVGGSRPLPNLITATLDLGEALAAVGSAQGSTWMIYSPTDGTSAAIATISVDNAWDTQRRRGLSPTERAVRSIV